MGIQDGSAGLKWRRDSALPVHTEIWHQCEVDKSRRKWDENWVRSLKKKFVARKRKKRYDFCTISECDLTSKTDYK